MCIVILSWFSTAYYLLLFVCEWSHERRIASCIVLVALCQHLLNSFVVQAYIHLMKQKSLSKFSLSRLVRWTELLEDKQYAKLGGVDTSQTYLLFQTLLLLFWPHSCMIWTKLTRTDVVFSRAAFMVLFCAGIWIFRCLRKFQEYGFFGPVRSGMVEQKMLCKVLIASMHNYLGIHA